MSLLRRSLSSFLVGTLILCISNCVCDEHEDDVYTVQYNSENFAEEVAKKNHFVMFYAPWCGHCRRLAPTWSQLAEMLNEDDDGNVRIAKVDCTVDSKVCSDQDVTGYPTLKFFKVGSDEPVKFRGTRDLPSLTSFINEQLGSEFEDHLQRLADVENGLVELNEENFNKHVAEGKHFVKFYAPWCGHCQKLAPVWEKLAQSLKNDDKISVSKIDCTQYRSICTQFDVKGFPTLLWIEDGKKIDKYQGDRSEEDLKKYVVKMQGNGSERESESGEELKEEVPSAVMMLTGDDFDHGVENGISIVKFFAPWCGHCKRLAPTWEELGQKFLGTPDIYVAKVDCTLENNKQLCSSQEVDGYPTIFLYKNGQKLSEYDGDRSLEDLYSFVQSHTSKHDEL